MDAAQVDCELAVDEHPDIVVAGEVEGVGLALVELEPVAHLAGEAEVVHDHVPGVVDLFRPRLRGVVVGRNLGVIPVLREVVVVDGEEARVAIHLRNDELGAVRTVGGGAAPRQHLFPLGG